MLDRQPRERPIDGVAFDHRQHAVRADRPVEGQDADVRGPRAPTPGLGVARVDEEATQPGLEAGRVAEGGQAPPGRDEGALQGILGEVGVAQDPRGDRVHPVAGQLDQRRECLSIAVSGPFDELLHPRSLDDARHGWRVHLQ